MVMEFVEGVTLDQRLKDGPLPAAEAVNYIMQVLSALEYAHARGVVHRDIKPANMMLTPAGVVKLMDFGIARSAADHKLTQTGTTVGSLYYMSPEQIQGVTAPDARSDLYSVGVSLYELVTGKRPFDGDSQFAIMSAHLQGTPVPPVTIDPRLPQLLNDVILMSVAKDRQCALSNRRRRAQRAFQSGVRTEARCRRTSASAGPCCRSSSGCRARRPTREGGAASKPPRTVDGVGRGRRRCSPSWPSSHLPPGKAPELPSPEAPQRTSRRPRQQPATRPAPPNRRRRTAARVAAQPDCHRSNRQRRYPASATRPVPRLP